jgi:hypothetical protein
LNLTSPSAITVAKTAFCETPGQRGGRDDAESETELDEHRRGKRS